jgi:hypothetical protein
MTVRIEGLEQARAALERALRAAGDGARDGLELVGQQGVTEIRRRSPVLTGRLRRSYTYETGRNYVEIASNVVYAPAQEFGSRSGPGTPHVRPGLEALRPQIAALIAEGAARKMRGAGSGLGASLPSVGATLREGL